MASRSASRVAWVPLPEPGGPSSTISKAVLRRLVYLLNRGARHRGDGSRGAAHSAQPQRLRERQLFVEAVLTRDGIGIVIVLLIREIARQQVSDVRIHGELAASAAGLHAFAETLRAAER